MKKIYKNNLILIFSLFVILISSSCSSGENLKYGKEDENDEQIEIILPKLKKANNIIVAHRGGSKEKQCPDNSMEALNYSIDLGCFATECDLYITKDNKVIVAHADNTDKINGYHPWKATYEEICSVSKLFNGEQIPLLEDYLNRVLEVGTIMLWLDIKTIHTLPTDQANEFSSRCAERASEIIRNKRANNFVELIVGRSFTYNRALSASKGDWNIAYMNTSHSPSDFKRNGRNWANFNISNVFYHNGTIKGDYSIDDYNKQGVRVSVYNVDNEIDTRWYSSIKKSLYAICTNYPKALIDATKN